ncbi:MAG: type II toxin-antitoxin system ParD family antitoxin [Pirellulales bacterium]|nr:type II toxin-antitoxin system ParD family antitoxin [Pirellulales bacterium]
MPTRNVNLTSHFDQFVAAQVSSGRFKNASEVMRAGLHLLEQQHHEEEGRLALLRTLAAEGFGDLDQGLGTTVSDQQQLEDLVRKIGRRAVERIQRSSSNG